jgi:hypothetical protein
VVGARREGGATLFTFTNSEGLVMATETHIAGLQMDVRGRYLLQRCGWCGAVMAAYDRQRVAVLGEWSDPALFEVGRLIRFSYDGPVARFGGVTLARTSMVMLDETDELPDDACALNVPFEDVVPSEDFVR